MKIKKLNNGLTLITTDDQVLVFYGKIMLYCKDNSEVNLSIVESIVGSFKINSVNMNATYFVIDLEAPTGMHDFHIGSIITEATFKVPGVSVELSGILSYIEEHTEDGIEGFRKYFGHRGSEWNWGLHKYSE